MTDPTPPVGGRITDLLLEQEMRESYLNYSMSVILSRALPDARDGLKPSQRRVLVAMNDLNLGPRSKHRKCAKICGDTSGNYHPHGESVVYPTLVGMAQPFRRAIRSSTARATSARSTAARLRRCVTPRRASATRRCTCSRISTRRPSTRSGTTTASDAAGGAAGPFPNLICNGSTGIAVGMAASLPPHNLREVAEGDRQAARQPRCHARRTARGRAGPRLPDRRHDHGPRAASATPTPAAAATVVVRAKYHVEEKRGRKMLVFTEVPFQIKTTTILERIDHLVKSDQIDSISDANDESNDRVGLRLVVELKKGVEDEQVTLNQLFKLSPLQSTFSIINLAILDGRPRTLGFKQMLECYRDHRRK
jgi:DNA gyrase subunit A